MCDPERLLERLNSVLVSVRTQNSAADVHEIGNIRNTTIMLIQAIEDSPSQMRRLIRCAFGWKIKW